MTKRVYLAGPMTGVPLYNFPLFDQTKPVWEAAGYTVTSPTDINRAVWLEVHGRAFDPAVDRCDYGDPVLDEMLLRDLVAVMRADIVAVLPGWQGSAGALREVAVAQNKGAELRDAITFELLTCEVTLSVTDMRAKAAEFLEKIEAERAELEPEYAPEFDPTSKPSNPKDIIGSTKLPLHLWPETATALGSLALLEGALKYGRANFRKVGVRASIYVDALRRHIGQWFDGEENDPDSKLPHLAHALACLAIIVDAEAAGILADDRNIRGGFRELVDELTPHVARLKALHAERSPKHYTIADNEAA